MSTSTRLLSTLLLLLFAAVLSVASAADGGAFTGDGTQYTLSRPTDGNCNFMAFPAAATTKYAALNKPQFKSTTNCGRCAQVSCVDAACEGRPSETVYIVDQCPECVRGDLDLSPDVFQTISGRQSDRVKIQWKFVDCPIEGPIQYCLKDGSNNFWTAIQPTNFLVGIQSMQVNGQPTTMVDSAYYFLRDGNSAVQTDLTSLQITLTSVSGEVVQDTVSLAGGGCVDSKFQFSTGRAADSIADFQDDASHAATQTGAAGVATAATSAPTTAAPTPSPSTTTAAPETPTPTPTPTPSTTPSPSESDSSSGSSAGSTSSPRLRSGSDEAGVTAAAETTPTTQPTPTEQAGAVRQITTRGDDAAHATSPVLMILLVLAGTCIVVLFVLTVVVKRKRLLEREAAAKDAVDHVSELPPLVVRPSSYEALVSPSRRTDTATL